MWRMDSRAASILAPVICARFCGGVCSCTSCQPRPHIDGAVADVFELISCRRARTPKTTPSSSENDTGLIDAMLIFDPQFGLGQYENSCVLWASIGASRRIQFSIPPAVLKDLLNGGNPVHDIENAQLCERERPRIEAACRNAFAGWPSTRITLRTSDFEIAI